MAHHNVYHISGSCQNMYFGDTKARDRLCYNCKEAGHLFRQCTKPRRAEGSSGGVRGVGQGRSGGRGSVRRRSGGRGSDRGRGGDRGRNPRTSRPRSPSRHRSPQRRPSRSRGRSGSSVATDQPNASPVRGGVVQAAVITREEVIVEQPPANTD